MDWYMEAGGNYIIDGKKVFGRNIYIGVDGSEKIRRRFNNTDVFITPYSYNNKDQDKSDLYGPLYIDLDMTITNEDDFNSIRKDLLHTVTSLNILYHVPYEYIKIFFSGKKGFHIMVMPTVFDINPDKDLNTHFKNIAADIKRFTLFKTIDTGIYDNRRLFRLPNSLHSDTGLYKVPVTIDFIRTCTMQQLLDYATVPYEMDYPEPITIYKAAEKFKEVIKKQKDEIKCSFKNSGPYRSNVLKPCIETMLKTGAPQGTRNNTTVIIASSLLQNGKDIDEVTTVMVNWNQEYNFPKLSDKEIKSTVKSAYNGIQLGKCYGCSSIKELGMCNPINCSISK